MAILTIVTEIAKIVGQLFFQVKSCVLFLTINALGFILGDFFKKTSGRPAFVF
jgi:hypothetical protein